MKTTPLAKPTCVLTHVVINDNHLPCHTHVSSPTFTPYHVNPNSGLASTLQHDKEDVEGGDL